ncbi:MAG: DUF4388 domain-containing protein [Chloroflexi bacterium]|nr:MAG: DUF4388 domain-containing protein [Chloroflexota bacterium]
MSPWFAVVAVIAAGLIAVVLLGSRRPRHAEDELLPAKLQPVRTEPAAFADRTSLTEVLRSVQARRLTGTLKATTGVRTASLYFLFGHLFHAVNGALTGETAVRDCATWHDVQYTVDDLTPVPTAKTIERPIDQILAA